METEIKQITIQGYHCENKSDVDVMVQDIKTLEVD